MLLVLGLVGSIVVTILGLAVSFWLAFALFLVVLAIAVALEREVRLLAHERLGTLPISAWLGGSRRLVQQRERRLILLLARAARLVDRHGTARAAFVSAAEPDHGYLHVQHGVSPFSTSMWISTLELDHAFARPAPEDTMTTTPAPAALMDRDVFDAELAEDTVGDQEARTRCSRRPTSAPSCVPADESLPADPFVAGWARRDSVAVEACIARFAVAEADVSSADLVGLGRVSGVRFPRLGGVLHGRFEPGSLEATLLASAVERTIRAAYHTALAMTQVAKVPVVHDDPDELWRAFVPNSYRIPRRVAATTWEVCRFDDFWVDVLQDLGLDGDAARFARGHVSALSRSIRGLSTVGMMLALAERGGRHDRLQTGRLRGASDHRSLGHAMPAAPRTLLAD